MASAGSRGAAGIIIMTDASCVINGRAYPNIPTLVWPDGVDEPASDWLRYLVVSTGAPASSAYEYAKIIRPFLRFCRARGRAWDSVDDDFLIAWRENMRRADRANIPRINTSIQTIFAFYRWAEETGRLRYHVGLYETAALHDALHGAAFAISARKTFSKGRRGKIYGSWTTPLTLSAPRTSQGRRHTPTEEETRKIHEVAVERKFGERDALIYSWAEEAGVRRGEILQVCKSHLPTLKELDELLERDVPWHVEIVRKRRAIWSVNVPADLILRTLDWISCGRAEIVSNCREAIVGYNEPDQVFISSSTGMPLHPDSVTKLSSRDFAAAGVKMASLHRLRAKFAVEVVQALVDAFVLGGLPEGSQSTWVETILTKASEQMGHMSPNSLRAYLNYVLDRKVRNAEPVKARDLRTSVRLLERRQDILRRLVDVNSDLRMATKLIDAGKDKQAAALLRDLAARMEKSSGDSPKRE
jgi:integrase